MAKAIIDTLSKYPKGSVKTITCDRGSEFACWREIEKPCTVICILPTRTAHGRKERTRT